MKTNIKKTMNYALLALAGIALIVLLITALSFKNTAHAAETLSYQRNLNAATGIELPWSTQENNIKYKFTNSGNVAAFYTLSAYFELDSNPDNKYTGDRMMTSLTYHRTFNNNKTYSDTQYITANNLKVSETRTFSGLMLTGVTAFSETDHTVDTIGATQIRELFRAIVNYN